MARTTLTVQTLANLYSDASPAANALDVTWTDGDSSNGNDYVPSEKDILCARNTHGSTAKHSTLFSVKDRYGRTEDVTQYSLAAGEEANVPVPADGYKQSDGKVWLACEDNNIEFKVIRLP